MLRMLKVAMNLRINYTFEQKIWHCLFYGHYIILELRDEIKRTVRYTCIDLRDNNICWENLDLKVSWYQSLSEVVNGAVCIYEYEAEDKPVIKQTFWVDVVSGELRDTIQNDSVPSREIARPQTPIHYIEENPYFSVIFNFLYRLLKIEAQKAVDYLEVGDKIIISYYIYHQNLLFNYLLVTNRKREVLLNKLIATSDGIGIDTFVVSTGLLLYVGNKNQLLGYEIET